MNDMHEAYEERGLYARRMCDHIACGKLADCFVLRMPARASEMFDDLPALAALILGRCFYLCPGHAIDKVRVAYHTGIAVSDVIPLPRRATA